MTDTAQQVLEKARQTIVDLRTVLDPFDTPAKIVWSSSAHTISAIDAALSEPAAEVQAVAKCSWADCPHGADCVHATPVAPSAQGEPSVDAPRRPFVLDPPPVYDEHYALTQDAAWQAQEAPATHHPEYVKGWNAARRLFGPQAAPAEQLAAALGWPGGISDPEQDWPTLLREVARRDPWQRAEQRLADAGHVAGEPTDDATKEQARDAVKRMNKARNFPSGTDACSRHVALMAETLAKGQPYPMLDEEREHCAVSLAITVAMLWEARAALSHQAGRQCVN